MGNNDSFKKVILFGAILGGIIGLSNCKSNMPYKIYSGTRINNCNVNDCSTVEIMKPEHKEFNIMQQHKVIPVIKSVCTNDNKILWD